MEISLGKSRLRRADPATAIWDRLKFQKILYCAWLWMALLGCVTGLTGIVVAQEDRPEITPNERKAPRKKDAGPRAVAVLQMAANGKASLVPIAILVNGRFWDATAYKADPVPMALESGTVYEAERTGNSLGLFTVGSALRSNVANAPNPWIGTGAWRPAGTEVPKTAHAAENVPVGIDTSDAPPRLSHGGSTASGSPRASTAPGGTSTAPPAGNSAPPPPSQPTGKSDSGDEPPRLSRGSPAPSQTPPAGSPPAGSGQSAPSSPPTSGEAKPGDTKPGDAKTGDAKTGDTKPEERANVPASDSGAGEANRPRLRRGKPAESFADEDVPGYSRPGATPAASPATGAKIVEITATKDAVQLIPAISDASGPEPRAFTYEWFQGEEPERQKQMMDLAKQQIRAYVVDRAKGKITAKPVPPQGSRHVAAAKVQEPILENVKMVTYDLWNSNQPVLILSAEAHMPPPAASTAHAEAADPDVQYSIMLVAYPDIYKNLHKLYAGVTDKFHLDVTPRMELIDAVDADGDGRGELLFRETSDAGTGWVIYRATADKLWKMFDSLNR
jgi:hypothetical protein